jgi:hypothetical protein
MKSKTVIYSIFFVVALLGLGGWCANVYKLLTTGLELAQWGGMEIARVIGIFVAPLGAVLGWF